MIVKLPQKLGCSLEKEERKDVENRKNGNWGLIHLIKVVNVCPGQWKEIVSCFFLLVRNTVLSPIKEGQI